MNFESSASSNKLKANSQVEMLEKLDELCFWLGISRMQEVDDSLVDMARETFGPVFAKGCEILWRWVDLFDGRQDYFAFSDKGSFEEFVETHWKPGVVDVPLFVENQSCWYIYYRPCINGVILEAGDWFYWSAENLAECIISHTLSEICVHFGGSWHMDKWLPQHILNNTGEWELLWSRTVNDITHPVCYAHISGEILVCALETKIGIGVFAKPGEHATAIIPHLCEPPAFPSDHPIKAKLEMIPCYLPREPPSDEPREWASIHDYMTFRDTFDDGDIPF